MKRGLVIGKFMPVHMGHLALIRFAAERCDELIVSMSYTPNDPIPPTLRFGWLQALCQDDPMIKPEMVADDFDDESLPLPQRTKIWSTFIRKTYPPIDIVFSSEEYGEPFAMNLGAAYIPYDPPRTQIPVSATAIRQHPFRHWEYIPPIVRPHFVKKICIYGPESTGKSTLTQRLAAHYQTEFVPEVAREIITSNDFTVDDIIRIGHAQHARIEQKLKTANKLLFCDTDIITTQLYSNHYLDLVPKILYDLERQVSYERYFLLDIDVPWVADDLRDLGHQREQMFTVFRQALERRNIPYILVRGTYAERQATIRQEIERLLAEG
ncbi:AAA family ATPase [Fulvivirgaceae bacterium PWU5]|uniref:AAA family ATPase n=1 Tax=Dawidia cretensis TaxID=2782350 RepID=A0AAP2GUW6_9BACT|nr:AAA family ATPase [Dawidia cretensis]MBT1708087.1 AAA family ATPase [Dawidia cretensis]